MTRGFIQSHIQDSREDLMPAGALSMSNWERWKVAETARRTILLANIIHFLGNHDPETGKPPPYYEPLNDELIMSLLLPCSHAL